jgi:membrane fusion protein (multidrug efflux system)
MKIVSLIALVLLPMMAWAQGGGSQSSGQQPSVLVNTETPRKGTLPRTLVAYGTVQAAPAGGSETMSLLRGGQVIEVLTSVGQTVRKGQPLLVVRAGPAAVAAYEQAVAGLTLAQGSRSRMAKMLSEHLATRDQLAQAEKAVTDAQATLDALKRAGGGSAEETLTAGFDGVVVNLMAAKGARVAAQTPLLTIARSSRLVAAVGVEPGLRDQLAVDQSAQVELLYATDPRTGRVVSVGAMLDPTTRLVPVLIDPSMDGSAVGGLLPGAPVRASVQIGQMTGWLAPRDAVLTDAKGPYVFQVDAGKARRVDVRIVGMAGNTTVITGQLDPSRKLITGGNYQLQDGVAIREAPASPENAAASAATKP